MTKINYITEEYAKELIEKEVEANKDKGFILSAAGFAQHGVDTGRIAHKVANKIIDNHPSLEDKINPDIVRTERYMHDFTKIYEGDDYHEVGVAYLILTKGDTDLGLVSGGSKSEIKEILKEMASLTPSDYATYEELGGNNYPDGALHKCVGKFTERVDFLRKNLSKTDEPLSMEEFALPYTLNQQIALYADLSNFDGEITSHKERIDDIIKRYTDHKGGYFNPVVADLTKNVIGTRLLVATKTIEGLME